MDGKLHAAPISPTPEFQVLDVGTGSGVWAMEFARSNPSSQVTGIDLSAIQSATSVPDNCQFQIANAEKDWNFPQSFDFIHSRLLLFGMHDWPAYFRRCLDHLKPGGWVEAQEVNYPLCCDDESAGSDSAVMRWGNLMHEAMAKGGVDPAPGDNFKRHMLNEGFTNVQGKLTTWACSPWPEDEYGKEIARLQRQNVLMALEGISTMVFMKYFGWTKQEVDALLEGVREDIGDLKKHVYVRV